MSFFLDCGLHEGRDHCWASSRHLGNHEIVTVVKALIEWSLTWRPKWIRSYKLRILLYLMRLWFFLQMNLPGFCFMFLILVKFFLRFKIKKNFGELSNSAMKRCLIETISNTVESVRRGRTIRKRPRSYWKGDNWGNDLWPSGTNFSHRQCHQTVRNHELKTPVASSSTACLSTHSLPRHRRTTFWCPVCGRQWRQLEKEPRHIRDQADCTVLARRHLPLRVPTLQLCGLVRYLL